MFGIPTGYVRGAFKEFMTSPRKVRWTKLKLLMLRSKLGWVRRRNDKAGYLQMQSEQYELAASIAVVKDGKLKGDYVAAVDWDSHNSYVGFNKHILKYVPATPTFLALEYGCGPGRNIMNWSSRFARIDGVDISANNLKNAGKLIVGLPKEKQSRLFVTKGSDTGDAPLGTYDLVFSVICLQHICVHEIRFSILQSLFKVLKPGGRIAFQLGFSPTEIPMTVPYFANFYQAPVTNGGCDSRVGDQREPVSDLEKIGFTDIECVIEDLPPDLAGGIFKQFIFINARKPE